MRIITTDEGLPATKLMYNVRVDGDTHYLFICNTDRRRYYPTRVGVRGNFSAEVCGTLTGAEWSLKTDLVDGWTEFDWHFEAVESLLLRLQPCPAELGGEQQVASAKTLFSLRTSLKTILAEVQLDSVEMDERNVLLLDRVSWRLEEEGEDKWSDEAEILHAENDVRRHLGLPTKQEAFRQPWRYTAKERQPVATVHLNFDFFSHVEAPNGSGDLLLALEQPEDVQVFIDGIKLPGNTTDHVVGWWVDVDIHTVQIPGSIAETLGPGKHSIELVLLFSPLTNLERIYLLGAFGVQIHGRSAVMMPLDLRELSFGDWTTQGLPFYAGNLVYHCTFTTPSDFPTSSAGSGTRLFVEIPRFCRPVVTVSLDGEKKGLVYLDPHVLELGHHFGPAETRRLDITCFGNRENAGPSTSLKARHGGSPPTPSARSMNSGPTNITSRRWVSCKDPG